MGRQRGAKLRTDGQEPDRRRCPAGRVGLNLRSFRQMPAASGRAGVAHGEAQREAASDEACGPSHEQPGTGSARPKAGAGTLLEAALTGANLQAAWKRVKANKAAAGVDGQGIEHTAQLLRTSWPQTRQALLAGTYRPEPVRRGMIPKPDRRQRELGIPTVLDRLIQQALLQALHPLIDPTASVNTATSTGLDAERTMRWAARWAARWDASSWATRCGWRRAKQSSVPWPTRPASGSSHVDRAGAACSRWCSGCGPTCWAARRTSD